jgi:hypothetical protein
MTYIEYQGWPNCYQLTNGLVDLVVTTDVGPRVIRFGFSGQANEFREYEPMLGQTGGSEWRIYGGHRLWHSPEDPTRTYYPDNEPVQLEDHSSGIRLTQPTETTTGIQKEMDIVLSPDAARVKLTHRLRNNGLWPVELAPWGLSVMAQGGRAIVPLPPRGSHTESLGPSSTLTLWSYTDMTDPRWTWGRKYILLQQDPHRETPQKIGAMVPDGWLAYARNNHLFVVTFDYQAEAVYPDYGVSIETFTDGSMLEIETLGPLTTLQPGGTVEHVETWWLFDEVAMPTDEAAVDQQILPKVRTALAAG